MAPEIATLDEVLTGPSDLEEVIVKDVPVPGKAFKIRALSVVAANSINKDAVSTSQGRGGPQFSVDTVKLDVLRLVHGVVEPKMNEEQARVVCSRYGAVIQKVIREINRISGIDEDTAQETEARFQGSGEVSPEPNGTGPPEGDAGPDRDVRAGAVAGNDGD